jgi:hypothetical protein
MDVESIKCGEDEEMRIIPLDLHINDWVKTVPLMIKKLKILLQKKIIDKDEYNETENLLKIDAKQHDLLLAKDTIKFHILRWTPKQILEGKQEYRGKIYFLKDVIYSGRVKVSLISFLYGYRYCEVSMIYRFKFNNGYITDDAFDISKLDSYMRNDVYFFDYENNYMKMAKRMMSVLRGVTDNKTSNHKELEQKLYKLFQSDMSRIYQICSDIDNIMIMIETIKDLNINKIFFVIDQFKNRLSNITNKLYVKHQYKVNEMINNIEHNILDINKYKILYDLLYNIQNEDSLIYLKDEGMYPVNKLIFYPKDYKKNKY